MAPDKKMILLGGVALAAIAGALAADPVAQAAAYHQFADRRTILGIHNFWNVVSNLPLALAGALGVGRVMVGSDGFLPPLRPLYLIFFWGAVLTAMGSAFYHLNPTHSTLAWDRLPMTLLFTALFSIVWGEHISISRARQIIWPLVVSGFAAVVYWVITENHGQGDLRAYGVIQFLPLLLMPLILSLYPSKLAPMHYLWGLLAIYLAAKGAEMLDRPIYNTTGGLSGHTIKHLVAAAGVYLFSLSGRRRIIRSCDQHAKKR